MLQTSDIPEKPQVLLIEDEKGLAEEIRSELLRVGHSVLWVDNAEEGLKAARESGAAILVLDRMLYGSDGLAIIEQLREEGIKTPVLVISALSSIDERIRGLKAGGDDYLVKPFAMDELAARVQALLRRLADVRVTTLRAGNLEMDLIEQTVKRGEAVIDLQRREFKLLEYFMRRPGQIVTRAMLLEEVWHYRFAADTNVVDVHISHLRRKVDVVGKPSMIINVRGAGFMLNAKA
jgi:two-component system OmpR family response regulator